MKEHIAKTKIFFKCPQCWNDNSMDLPLARYYLRTHEGLTCSDCHSKFKPYALDIFQELAENPFQKIDDISSLETGTDVSQRSLQVIIVEALKKHPMTKNDLRNQINCGDETKFERAFSKLMSDSMIYNNGYGLDGHPVYASTL